MSLRRNPTPVPEGRGQRSETREQSGKEAPVLLTSDLCPLSLLPLRVAPRVVAGGQRGLPGPPVERGRTRPQPVVVDLPRQLLVNVTDVVLVHLRLRHARAGPLLVPREVQPLRDLLRRLLAVDPLLHGRPQFREVPLLLREEVLAGELAVARADDIDVELLHRLQALDPARRVRVAHVV